MICPACGHDQPDAAECGRCGVLVARYKPRVVREIPPVQARTPRAPLRPLQAAPANQAGPPKRWLPERPAPLPKRAQFFQQLGRLAGAGVGWDEALETLLPLAGPGTLQRAIVAIRADLQAEVPLPQAMRRHPLAFDEVEVAVLEAALHTGGLVQACAHLQARLTNAAEVSASVRAALAYPLFVLAVSFVLLPAPLLFTDGVAAFLLAAGVRLLGLGVLLAGVALGGPALLARRDVRARLLGVAARLPGVGWAMTHRRLATTLEVLARGVQAGVPLPKSLELAGRASGEPAVERAVTEAQAALQAGRSLSAALQAVPGLPEEGRALVAAGEKSGHLAETLQEQADAWHAAWRRDLRWGGLALRWGLSLVVLLSVAWSIVDQFRQVLGGDPLALVPGPEGEELRQELGRAMKQLPKGGAPLP